MALGIKSVYIAPMKCSNGLFFYTKFQNENDDTICPFMSQELWKAIHEGDEYAKFFDLELELPCEQEWLPQALIDDAVKEARLFNLDFNPPLKKRLVKPNV